MATPRNEALLARLLCAQANMERLDGNAAEARRKGEAALELAYRAGVVPVAASCCLLLARLTTSREEALNWSRRALLDADVCGQAALEAEALLQASMLADPAHSTWFLAGAQEAWRRATAGLTPAMVDSFGSTEERRPLREAAQAWSREEGGISALDTQRLLATLALKPIPAKLWPALVSLARDGGRVERLACFWKAPSGDWHTALSEGPAIAGASTPQAELEDAQRMGEDALIIWLGVESESWGALLLSGFAAHQRERLEKLLPMLSGSLWAAWQLWLCQ